MAKKWLVVVLGAVLMAGAASVADAGSDSGSGGGDRAAFERILREQQDAWYREDGAAFARHFTENADLVTFNGDHLRTRQGIAEGMQYYFDKYIDHTKLKTLSSDVRFTGPSMAIIVRTACQLVPPSTECRADSLSRNTNVMVKRDGRWWQESFQNTRVVALP
ncbi:SgcJ/EcaC family oxidoreductase [Actinocrispum sp. NPDC049592]|uniref:SgcJ/EcaC family oxidoreductase n=1 Tax=Actinocrispum sp. NPDC049592 TaxID=3154835 RepID=UPI00343783EC